MGIPLILAIIAVIALIAVLFVQHNKMKTILQSAEKERIALEEKEKILFKEAKLAKREDMLEDKIQEYTEKDIQVQHKIDELLEKEDYLAEIVQRQTTELERIAGMTVEEAKNTLTGQSNRSFSLGLLLILY